MKTILAIDPGPEESAFVVFNRESIGYYGKRRNIDLLLAIENRDFECHELVLERVASFGMPVGEEVFETVFWTGIFAQAWGGLYHRIKRHQVKMHLCQNMRAKDGNIRQALIDKFGGKQETKKGGTLHGISGDVWSALAVGITYLETCSTTELTAEQLTG